MEPTNQDYEAGLSLYHNRAYDQALLAFRQSSSSDQKNPLPLVGIGHSYLMLNQPEEARRAIDEALTLDPECNEARLALAAVFSVQGDTHSSQVWLVAASQAPGNSVPRQIALAMLARSEGDFKSALDHYLYANELNPNDPRAYYGAGIMHLHLAQHIEAHRMLRQAQSMMPRDPNVLYNLGYAEQRLGDYQQAIRDYSKAILLQPAFHEAHVGITICLLKTRKWLKALQYFILAVKSQPSEAREDVRVST